MTGLIELDRSIAAMIAAGFAPGAIIMEPTQMKHWLKTVRELVDPEAQALQFDPGGASGWSYKGLPLYRSYEIAGPTVVSEDVLRMLLKAGRHRLSPVGLHSSLVETAAEAKLDPIIF